PRQRRRPRHAGRPRRRGGLLRRVRPLCRRAEERPAPGGACAGLALAFPRGGRGASQLGPRPDLDPATGERRVTPVMDVAPTSTRGSTKEESVMSGPRLLLAGLAAGAAMIALSAPLAAEDIKELHVMDAGGQWGDAMAKCVDAKLLKEKGIKIV